MLGGLRIFCKPALKEVMSIFCLARAEPALSLCPRCEVERAGIRGVKIGNIFRQFSIKNADTSEQKSNFSKNF